MAKTARKARTTATLTPQQGQVLKAMADHHKISVSWLIRYAVDRLIEDEAKGAATHPPDAKARQQ